LNFSPNSSVNFQPTSITPIANQDSPSPISSQNSTSGDDNSIYNRNQQQQKKKGIRNSFGRLFTRKPDSIDNKPIRENTPINRGKFNIVFKELTYSFS
jgi:hypothetical protein